MPVSPTNVFAAYRMLFELGLLVGITEIIVAIIAFIRAKSLGQDWLKLFGLGVLFLAIAQIGCKAIARYILHIPFSIPVGVPFKTIGLTLVLYSLLRAIEHPKTKILTYFIVATAVYFLVGSFIGFSMLHAGGILFFTPFHIGDVLTYHLPHLLFLVIDPLVIAYYMYELYREVGDRMALFFSVGLVIYAIASLIVLVAVQFTHVANALLYTLVLRALAMLVILLGTV